MSKDVILVARLGKERIGFRASDVQSVVDRGTLSPVPRAPSHVAGLSALRSQALTVINCAVSIGLNEEVEEACGQFGVVVASEGCLYSLLVDEVEGVSDAFGEPEPLKSGLAAGWERVALGTVDCEMGTLLLVDPARIIAGPDAALSRAA